MNTSFAACFNRVGVKQEMCSCSACLVKQAVVNSSLSSLQGNCWVPFYLISLSEFTNQTLFQMRLYKPVKLLGLNGFVLRLLSLIIDGSMTQDLYKWSLNKGSICSDAEWLPWERTVCVCWVSQWSCYHSPSWPVAGMNITVHNVLLMSELVYIRHILNERPLTSGVHTKSNSFAVD